VHQSGADEPQILERLSSRFHQKESTLDEAADNSRTVQIRINLADHFKAKRFALRGALTGDLERLFIGNAARIE